MICLGFVFRICTAVQDMGWLCFHMPCRKLAARGGHHIKAV